MKTFIKIMIIFCAIMVVVCIAWCVYGICVKEASIIVTGASCAVVNTMSLVLLAETYKMPYD